MCYCVFGCVHLLNCVCYCVVCFFMLVYVFFGLYFDIVTYGDVCISKLCRLLVLCFINVICVLWVLMCYACLFECVLMFVVAEFGFVLFGVVMFVRYFCCLCGGVVIMSVSLLCIVLYVLLIVFVLCVGMVLCCVYVLCLC